MATQREVAFTSVWHLIEQLVVERSEQEAIGRRAGIRVVDNAVLERKNVPARRLGHPCARAVPTLSAQSMSQSSASATISASSPVAICSSVNAKSKSKLKSLPYDDTYGNFHPIRRL
jgi:hypothetical protein